MKSFQHSIEKKDWRGRIPFLLRRTIKSQTWSRTRFREVNIYDHQIENCKFFDCEFQHCRIGNDVHYENCLWKDCYFWGQYSNLGGGAMYKNCRFENVTIKNGLWTNVSFVDCYFSGKFINTFWEGRWADSGKSKLKFLNCDMREMNFENVTVKAGINFSTTQLPTKGVRLFDNQKNRYSDAFLQAAESNKYEMDISCSLKIIGEFAENQHPIILDDIHLDKFPGPLTSDDRRVFEIIAAEFEIFDEWVPQKAKYV